MSRVHEYIKEKLITSIHKPDEQSRGIVKMPKEYSVPCANIKDVFSDFYYWDTYFASFAFMLGGMSYQAENNLDLMAYFIHHLGFMPNANHLLNRSQPPLFSRGVMDLYRFNKDKNMLKKFLPEMLREYDFFQYDRSTEIGLNQFRNDCLKSYLLESYPSLSDRVGEKRETVEEQIELTMDLLCIAESGWDFNPRFDTEQKLYAAREFVHLDLNCLLYDMERNIAEIATVLGDNKVFDEFTQKANVRKERMEKYMLNHENGVFYDYNFKLNQFSNIISCASFYPFAVGLSTDKEAAKEVLQRLELPFGLAACEYRGEDANYLQWDYPSMWPSNVYFAYTGLKNVGLTEDARRIAVKYMDTVDRSFEQTGSLWEKYDASQGEVSVTREYETPQMMGWTAGVYQLLYKEIYGK